MKASEKAEVLIQQAQAKAQADFEKWKEEYLSAKLKHRTGQDAKKILREKYTALQDWYLKHNSPKPLFDVVNTPRELLALAWAGCFADWKSGLIPIPGRTPEYAEESFDLISSQPQGPYIPTAWMWPLAECFKVALCLEYLDRAISDKLEVWQRKKYEQIAFFAKLAIHFALKQGALPEGAILEAIEKGKAETGKAGMLPEDAVQELALELLEECRGTLSEDELTYLLKRIDSVLQRKPQKQEASTRIWALYYWYLWQAGEKPELDSGSGKKKALKALALEHGISAQKLFQVFNAVGRNSQLNPKNQHILEVVIPMLADFSKAQAMAQEDFQKLKKHKEA
jgi:hypothetical protein